MQKINIALRSFKDVQEFITLATVQPFAILVGNDAQQVNGKSSTANFLSGMMQSIPPLHDVAGMAGIDLPGYLGKIQEDSNQKETPAQQQ